MMTLAVKRTKPIVYARNGMRLQGAEILMGRN